MLNDELVQFLRAKKPALIEDLYMGMDQYLIGASRCEGHEHLMAAHLQQIYDIDEIIELLSDEDRLRRMMNGIAETTGTLGMACEGRPDRRTVVRYSNFCPGCNLPTDHKDHSG